MRLIPKGGNDEVNTPNDLARDIVAYFNPKGRIIEPCSGDGVFLNFLPNADWCEIKKGRDFLLWEGEYDWAITNPPYSKIRKFLLRCYKLKIPKIVFLCPTNHILGLKARIRDMHENNYGVKEILLVDTPKEFPQSGFQLSVNFIELGYEGDIVLRNFYV